MKTLSVPRVKTRIALVEDHTLFREALVGLLTREADLCVCGQADGAPKGLEMICETKPDLVLLDIALREGDGLELIKAMGDQCPEVPVLVVSMQDEAIFAERALRAGARGYVMKDQSADRLLEGIHAVLAGDVFVSARVNARLLRSMVHHRNGATGETLDALTDREIEVFQLIGAGLRTGEIADRLGISPKTVETHRENIKQKLGLRDGVALTQAAARHLETKPV